MRISDWSSDVCSSDLIAERVSASRDEGVSWRGGQCAGASLHLSWLGVSSGRQLHRGADREGADAREQALEGGAWAEEGAGASVWRVDFSDLDYQIGRASGRETVGKVM